MSAGTVGAFSRKRSFEPGVEKHERRGMDLVRADMAPMLPNQALRSAGVSCSVNKREKRAGSPATNLRHSLRPSM